MRPSHLARAVWVLLTAGTLAMFMVGVPALFAALQTPCSEGVDCLVLDWQPTAGSVEALQSQGLSLAQYARLAVLVITLPALVWILAGGIVIWRRADERMARLAAFFMLAIGALGATPLLDAAASVWPVLLAPGLLLRIAGDAALGLFFFVFPDGRFVPPWTRWLAVGWVLLQIPSELGRGTAFDPNTWPAALFLPIIPGFFLVALGVQIWRYRRVATPLQRLQTKWVVLGAGVALVGHAVVLTPLALGMIAGPVGSPGHLWGISSIRVLLLLVPLSIVLAILRYRLWNVDALIRRTLVYAALSVSVVVLYVGVVGYLGLLFRADTTTPSLVLSLITTAVIAVLFQPLREWLQRLIGRMLYGERDDPYAVLSRLNRRLEATVAPEDALQTIVNTVREALRVPYAAITVCSDRAEPMHVEAGTPAGDGQRWPLTYQHAEVGELIVGPRAPGESLGPADRLLLDDLARQTGVVAHAVTLTADLRRARERLVTAREEERRRLRRDLHDGLGPHLASQTLTIDAARSLMQHDPEAADTLLRELKAQTQTAIADVRRLVYALRPPALDDLGLVGALRETTAAYAHAGLLVEVEAPSHTPPLPAAVEVAAFRIASEAVTNAARHANATRVCLRLAVESNHLRLLITDDGRGMEPDARAGIGLTSMAERAEELGGRCEISSPRDGGTRVDVSLPLLALEGAHP